MLFSPGRVLLMATAAMTAGGFLGLAARSVVLFVVTFLVLSASIGRPRSQLASAAAAIAAAASGAYHIALLLGVFGLDIVAVLLALLATWLAIHATLERILALDLEKSRTLTSSIACTSFLLWLILGALMTFLQPRAH